MIAEELQSEQAYLDHAHERLDAMREAARALSAEVMADGAGGTFANRVERDIRVELSGRRLAQLNIGDASVCFGRLDYTDGFRAYIGRIGVSDENGDQLVVDWRAPVAEPFYRATPADPSGVTRRRHFLFRGRTIVGIDDELLDRKTASDLVLVGEGALLAGLERARTGRMHDIVSTIQLEQDAVIRSDLAGVLVVQGGAGTGKTAVALHRAAYLLFTHRQRLERDGVLLVGPNSVFLRYIEQVLPSLGEHTVAMATPGELYAGTTRPTAVESREIAELKGEARMAAVLASAVRTRERALRDGLVMGRGRHDLVVAAGELRRIVAAVRERGGTHNARRSALETMVARALVRAWREAEERSVRTGDRLAIERSEQAEVSSSMASDMRRDPVVRAGLQRMWPLLTPEELLHDLFGARPLLREAGRGILSEREQDLLYRERSASLGAVEWTAADIGLLDEAAQLLGPPHRRSRGRRRGEADDGAEAWMLDRVVSDYLPDCPACGTALEPSGGERPWHCPSCDRRFREDQVSGSLDAASYSELRGQLAAATTSGGAPATLEKGARLFGHVVVDEAQGLSPMQWRALSRRCPAGSFTVVGDLGQASTASMASNWPEALTQVRSRSGVRVVELTVNYRTPAEVMALASAVLTEAAPALRAPRSVRHADEQPLVVKAASGRLVGEVLERTRSERARLSDAMGKTAVIAPLELLEELSAGLEAPLAGGPKALTAQEARSLLDAPVSVLSLDAARGLEFDSVVLVEPAALVEEHAHGLSALYVALTRTTRRLVIVHELPLPPSLARSSVGLEPQAVAG